MARPDFLYYLFSKNKKPLYVDEKGFVQEGNEQTWTKPDGQPVHLTYAPEGWKDTLAKYARNIKYWGLFRDMTVPMKFVKDGGTILKNRMWNFGVECICHLGILKLDRTTLPYTYKPWFVNEINFLKFRQTKTGVQAEALEGGLSKYLKAYENTVYTIPIDEDDEHISITHDGMDLIQSSNFTISAVQSPPTGGFLPVIFIANDGQAPNLSVLSQEQGGLDQFFVKNYSADTPVTIQKFAGAVRFKPNARTQSVTVYLSKRNGATITDVQVNTFTSVSDSTTYEITYNYSTDGSNAIVLAPGEVLLLQTRVIPKAGDQLNPAYITYEQTDISLSFQSRFRTTYPTGLWPIRLFEKIVEKMTEAEPGTYSVKSSFLSSLTHQYAIVSGDSIRGIEKATIKTSLSDFFKSFNARWSIGLGVEGDQLVIEQLPYFFQNTVIYDAGEVKDAEDFVADDLLFNGIKAGYPKQEYKEVNGRLEFNQGQYYSLPITRITKDLDLVSVYRADPFGIESLRAFGQKKTTDNDSDNDTFFLHVKKNFTSFTTTLGFVTLFPPINFPFVLVSGKPGEVSRFKKGVRFRVLGTASNDNTYTVLADAVLSTNPNAFLIGVNKPLTNEDNVTATIEIGNYILNRPAYSSVEGLLHPGTTFNIELSPKRGLLNNGPFIRSCTDYYLDTEKITFRSADKNTDLKTVLAGVTISESADVQIGALGKQLFRPYYFTFTTQVPVNLTDLINENPYGKVKFWVEGVPFYGFLMDGGIKPATNDTQQWKLLCAPENDLKKFQNAAF